MIWALSIKRMVLLGSFPRARENVLLDLVYLEGSFRLQNQELADGGEVSPYEGVLLLPVIAWLRLSCLERYWENIGRSS